MMKNQQNKIRRIRISDRDRTILLDIAEHRLAWFDTLKATFFASSSDAAVRSWLRRAASKNSTPQLLKPRELDRRVYYQLTHKATRILGVSSEAARSFGPKAIARLYARQWYLRLASDSKRFLFHPRKFPELFALEGHRLPQANFFIEESAEGRKCGFIVLDYNADARRIIRRTAKKMERFLTHGWFNEFIGTGRFVLVVLTVTNGKAEVLRSRLEKDLLPRIDFDWSNLGETPSLNVRVEVVPGLAGIIPVDRLSK